MGYEFRLQFVEPVMLTKIVMIRPKMWLANDGNYREIRCLLTGDVNAEIANGDEQIVAAPPTAEVEPIRSNYSQTCRRIISSTGFVVLENLLNHIAESVLQMGTKLTRAEVADKVKYYSIPSIDGQGRLAQVVRVTLEGK
ncbi:hypothetical protein H5410_033737 [Solanum commersonii]|uniref:Uncharacterized protein n=1 Tax=Solanum commersonii TaxID=4109 RepID=A0A9J5YRG4_SOLCO|nr:hypothetical protein H5410_033737 [Solanum commersonii]